MTERSKFLDRFPATPPPPLPPPDPPAVPQTEAPARDGYFGRVETRPPTFTPAAPPKRSPWPVVIAAVLVLGAAATLYATHSGGADKTAAPKILPPDAPTAGIPASLGDVVREQAESYRHTALQAVEQATSSDPDELHQIQPSFQWVPGTTPSTGPTIVSVGQDSNGITVAVSASNKQICAFGRWAPAAAATYVTVENQPACAAADAPATGWSTQAGGSVSDLPDDAGS